MSSYVTPEEVRAFLSLDVTVFTDDILNQYINMAEGEIERLSLTCWNGKECLSRLEYHTLTKYLGGIWYGAGIPVHLKYRYVKRFTRLEVFNGSEYEDWLATRKEARNVGDWWCDYEEGILYINAFWYYQGGKEVRVQYVYGRDDLPWYVKELTMLIASKYVLMFDRRRLALVETGQSIDVRGMLEQINGRIEELIPYVRAVGTISGTVP